MTHERLLYLAHLVDRVNTEINASAAIQYGKNEQSIYVLMFYAKIDNDYGWHAFHTSDGYDTYESTNHDTELMKAECFLRLLLNSAKHYPPMRAKS